MSEEQVKKKRVKPKASVFERDRIRKALGFDHKDKTNQLLIHIGGLAVDRNDMERLGDIRALYFEAFPELDVIQPDKFYWWYRDYPLSAEDTEVYDFYMAAVEQFGVTRVSPNHFSAHGYALAQYLLEWMGEAGNSLEEMLVLYFDSVLGDVAKFNKGLFHTPKSILGDYGRSIFNKKMEDQGGKSAILRPTDIALKKRALETKKLIYIQERRQALLDAGDVSGYDRIGRELVHKGIDVVYKELLA